MPMPVTDVECVCLQEWVLLKPRAMTHPIAQVGFVPKDTAWNAVQKAAARQGSDA